MISGTGGDPAAIMAIGYDLASDVKVAVGAMPHVTTLVVTAGDNDGELNPSWDPVTGADNFEVQVNTDPTKPAQWLTKLSSSQSHCTIHGLPSGVRHWVRVRANGPMGPGP
ncbi:MAG: fibronectin type III domain-containing protein [Planctomycetota bacterium]